MNRSDLVQENLSYSHKKSRVTRNPFFEIERNNLRHRILANEHKKQVRYSVSRAFDRCNPFVSHRLRQLGKAVMPEASQGLYASLLRVLCTFDLVWWLAGRAVRYRVIRSRKEGLWGIELFKRNHYSSFGANNLLYVRFHLDKCSTPCGFHVTRCLDNKMFQTKTLAETQLTEILLCHCSRLRCGSSIEEDIQHLKCLHEQQMISTVTYADEKKSLLSSHNNAHIYVLPVPPAHLLIKRNAHLRLLFSLACILAIIAIILFADMHSCATPSVDKNLQNKALIIHK